RAIPHVVRESVEAIRQWEPRCRLLKVTPVIDGEHLTLRVQWRAADGVINSTEVLWR
ncbi:baseplate protein, partial [Escherichia coli]|nr:baseplate protein [Escherichia coli]